MEHRFLQRLRDDLRIRVWFRTDRGQVISFVRQLELRIKGTWHPVVRYDTAHGFAHRDELHPGRVTDKIDLGMSFAAALSYSQVDLRKNARRYAERFAREYEDAHGA